MPDPTKPDTRSFWARYDNPNNQKRNQTFADAINRYLDAKYPLPRETSPVRSVPKFVGDAFVSQFINPAATSGAGLVVPFLAANEIISSLLGNESALQQLVPQGAIDITNPAVVPGTETSFTPLERFVRDIRLISRAAGTSLFRGASLPVGTQLGYLEGELAPPKDGREAVLHMIGSILAGAVPFVAAGGLAAPAQTAVRGGFTMPGALGAAVRPATGLARGLAEDVAIGGALGATEAVAEGQVADVTGEERPDVAKYARDYALFGLGLGALFRIPTNANVIRLFKNTWRSGPPKLDVAPGLVHDGIQTELVNGKVRFRDASSGRFVTPEDVGAERVQVLRQMSATKAQDVAAGTPAGQVAQQAATQATPENPASLPPELATPDNLNKMNLYGGMYLNRAKGMVVRLGREKMERQLEELRKIMVSDEPENVRLAVGGRVLAIERALGEGQRLPGQLPVELEANALDIVARALPRGREEVLRIATDAALDGRVALANRIRQLLDSELPETYSGIIQKQLAKASTAKARGFREGTQGVFNGRPVEIMQRPKIGLAWAKYLDEPSPKPVLVDVAEVLPMPKANQSVMLKDGRLGHVNIVDPANSKFLAQIHGRENAEWIPIDQIDEIASSPSTFRSQEAQLRSLESELDGSNIQEIPATPAVTETGEPVTVVGVGESAVEVRTKSDRKKTVARDKVRGTVVEPGSREIATFAPGKIPEQGNRILYFRVFNEGKGRMDANFRQAWSRGERFFNFIRDKRKVAGGKNVLQAHVLPQPASGDDLLYAIELPASVLPKKAYSSAANEAVLALGGKGTVKTHTSWVDVPEDVFSNAQIYEISESLRGATVRPDATLRSMSPEEQVSYLRNLLVANENIPSEIAEPIAAAKVARKKIAEAVGRGDGEAVLTAESQLADAHVQAAEASEQVRLENTQTEISKVVDEVRQEEPDALARENFEVQGLNKATEPYYFSKLEELPTAMAGDFNKDAMVAHSLTVDGQRAFISRYGRPHFVEGRRGATPEVYPYYEIDIVNPEGAVIRGASQQFDLPQEVTAWLQKEGYEPTLYHTLAGDYQHRSNNSLTAIIRPLKKGRGAEGEVSTREAVGARRETLEVPELDDLDRELMVELREGHREVASNAPQWKTVATKKVKNTIEADAFLQSKGFVRKAQVPDLAADFKAMPSIDRINNVISGEEAITAPPKLKRLKLPWSAEQQAARQKVLDDVEARIASGKITKEEGTYEFIEWERKNRKYAVERVAREGDVITPYLRTLESNLTKLMTNFVRNEGRVPLAVQTYAHDFAKLYYEHVGVAPFSKEVRMKWLGDLAIPHVEDYGPREAPSVLETVAIDGEDQGFSVQSGIVPDDIRTGISVGKNIAGNQDAALKLAQLIGGRQAPGLQQTQMWLVGEFGKLVEVFKKSRSMPEIEAATERLQLLRRTAVAFEKLRLGIKPTSRAVAGAATEADLITRASRRGIAGAAQAKAALTPEQALARGRRGLSEMDLLPANEEVMRRIASLDETLQSIMEGPHGPEFRTLLPHDFEAGGHVFYPHVLGISTQAKSDLLQEAARIVKARKQQTIWTDAAAKMEKVIPEPSQFSIRTDINSARYTPTNQLVEIIDGPAEILTGSEVRVRFMDGQEMTVSKSDIRLQGKKTSEALDYRMAEYILDGRYAATFKREPPIGMGNLERSLGLMGTNSRPVIAGATFSKAAELLRSVDPKAPTGASEVWDELVEMWRRGKWLDKVEEPSRGPLVSTKTIQALDPSDPGAVRTAELVPGAEVGTAALKGYPRKGAPQVTESVSDAVIEAIRQKDPKLVKPFKYAAYNKVRQALGDDPFAELQAQATAGFLGPEQEGILREFASSNGLSINMPLEKIVVELRERQLLDPYSALMAVQVRKEAGIMAWAAQAAGSNALYMGIPIGGIGKKGLPNVTIKPVASVHDLRFGGILGSSWRVASKHPTSRYVSDLLYRAQENEKRSIIKRTREFTTGLEQMGLKWADRKAIRRMTLDAHANNWKMWDDIAANSEIWKALPKDKQHAYQRGFFEYRRFYADRLQDLKRHFLRRRVKPIIYDSTNEEHRAFALMLSKEYGVDMASLTDGTALMPFTPELVYKNGQFSGFGLSPRGYTEDEISFFLRLQEQYGSEAEIPLQAPPGIRPEIYDEFREVFDFWQRYGQVNYWPLVHEGSIAAINAEGKILAWGQTVPDVLEHLRTLVKDGKISTADAVEVKQVHMIADDITMSATKSAKEFRQIAEFYAEQTHMDPDEVMAIITKAERPRMEMNKPGQVHGKPRKAGLEPVNVDPDMELGLYNARIARMDYRWDVLNAWKAFTDTQLDRALSDAYGAPRMHEKMPHLKDYMTDMFATAVGERRGAEKVADVFWSVLNMAREAPREFNSVLKGELNIWDVLDPRTYYRKYAARQRASDLLGLQTLVKLGFSMGSAFANWTQFFVTTLPKLVTEGENAGHIANLVWTSQRDAFKIFRAKYPLFGQATTELTGELRVLTELLDEAGVDLLPAKTQAGGRSVGDVLGGPPSLGESKFKYAADWLSYKALYAFNGAEKINRFSTSLAAIRKYADRLGKPLDKLTSAERGEAVESARRLVRETQFLYDELSLPRALRSGPLAGPIGRILFQFKPFMLNMMEYEMGLMKNAFFNPGTRFSKVAMGQLGTHFAAMSALGGAVGLLYNPLISLPYQLISWVTGGQAVNPANQVEAAQRERRRQMDTVEDNYQQSWHAKADDVLFYGLPGLVGLDLGQRVGVSGQDLLMTLDAPGVLGPHASAYYDIYQAWKKYGASRGHGRAVAGAAAGALASTFLPQTLRKEIPWVTSIAANIGAALASKGTANDFGEFLFNSPEGARVRSRLGQSAVKNMARTFELIANGSMRDMDGKPMHVPVSDRASEAAWLALGLPSTRREEYSAAINMMTGQAAEINNTRQILTQRAARAWADGNYGEFYEIMSGAAELDIDLDSHAIERELESLTQERMSTVFERLPSAAKIK